MPSLRQRLKNPATYLWALLVLAVAFAVDSSRGPSEQLSGALYVTCVRGYQALTRPWLSDVVRCRYTPSCSEYSIRAVQVHGIRKGLLLTVRRIRSCTTEVPMHTPAPVPDAA